MQRIIKIVFLLIPLFFFSCADDENAANDPEIIGTYVGNLEVFHENGSSEIVEGEELDIILTDQDQALIKFKTSLLNNTTVYSYPSRIVNEFTLSVDQEEVNPGTRHTGQASLSGQNISVIIKDLDFGDNILNYQGEKL